MYQGNKKYTNGEITVFWYPKKCIHATHCYRELIEVFNPGRRPWINMNGAPTKEIIRVVKLCPTQALDYKYNNEDANIQKSGDQSVAEKMVAEARIMKNGPLVLKGDFTIIDADGKEIKHHKTSLLCRCGASKNPPFCDGTHSKTGYLGN